MEYVVLKQIHVACVALSFAGFFVRGVWMIRESPMLRRRWVRIAPHVVDTVLLASAVALAVLLQQYPFVHSWLTAKVAGLLVYIALGMAALRMSAARPARIAAWIAALLVFGYVAAVALTKNIFIFQ